MTPRETEKERWERNFGDLLQEMRVAQAGVQILFAFLLTLPFSSGFPKTTDFQRGTYMVALLMSAAAAALIISPVAFHRALFRQGRKSELVKFSHAMATGGLACMLVAMVSAILLITDFILPRGWSITLTTLAALVLMTFWVGLPIYRRSWGDEDASDSS